MKKKLVIALILMIISIPGYALEWHEELIEMLLKQPIRDQQVVVERDEKYMTIKRASYRFSFNSDRLEKEVRQILFSHQKEAQKFSNNGREILMQVKEYPNTYYTYSLGLDPKNPGRFLLLISVKQGSFTKPEDISYLYPHEDYGVELKVFEP